MGRPGTIDNSNGSSLTKVAESESTLEHLVYTERNREFSLHMRRDW